MEKKIKLKIIIIFFKLNKKIWIKGAESDPQMGGAVGLLEKKIFKKKKSKFFSECEK